MTRHKCFNCDAPTETQVNRTRPPALRKFICTDTNCWRAWWALTDKRKASRVSDVFCLKCGCALAPCLARLGSLYCHDDRGAVAGGLPNTAPTPLIVEPPSLAARENAAQQVAA